MPMPLNLRIERAKNDMSYQVKRIMVEYDLPDVVVDLIIDHVRAKELEGSLSLLAEQIEYSEPDAPTENAPSKETKEQKNE